MTPILLRIAATSLLSVSSLMVILFRVSPFTAAGIAVPLFFLTVFLSSASTATLLCYAFWSQLSVESMDAGRRLSVSLREGMFVGIATILLFLFLILGILTWWIGVLIYLIFLLVEMALLS